jgi:hypothetical protein
VRLFAELALAALAAALAAVLLGLGEDGRAAPACPPARITARTPLYAVERHFGPPLAQTIRPGGLGTFLYAGRRHNWTIVLQIRPIPRRGEAP